eukprot:CAMPEP_0194078306 /NCGR_PEP_ID=MMETSP0149-20130528/4738_1 /TAXON_ID=122233 /ORGANISM="Chaetoceros debilis, Strain MM31A-1" /LENGTH=889 /DNA_ID=CAMNT_0038759543 /DNA_START=360 /DNA_END=3029 /DNA_ORIENTATION=-
MTMVNNNDNDNNNNGNDDDDDDSDDDDDNKNKKVQNANDRRAQVKLDTLQMARGQTNKTKAYYQKAIKDQFTSSSSSSSSKSSKSSASNRSKKNTDEVKRRHNDWMTHEILLADAYSKAIKYTAKLNNVPGAALRAQIFLDEMIARHDYGDIDGHGNGDIDGDGHGKPLIAEEKSNFMLQVQGMNFETITVNFNDMAVDELLNAMSKSNKPMEKPEHANANVKEGDDRPDTTDTDTFTNTNPNPNPKLHIPPPTKRECHNVLHAYASSKLKKKGLYAENLLYRMMELAFWYPTNSDCNSNWNSSSKDGVGLGFGGVMPDSKTFAIAIKSYGGSTYKDALDRIKRLHQVHEQLAAMDSHAKHKFNINIGNIDANADDPFFLMHSIKAVQKYTQPKEMQLMEEWFQRLHKSVMNTNDDDDDNDDKDDDNDDDADNIKVQNDDDDEKEEEEGIPLEPLELTGTYNAVLRNFAKLRGRQNEAEKAARILEQMRDLYEINMNMNSTTLMGENDRRVLATVDVKTNSYNLVLGAYSTSKEESSVAKARILLDGMIDSAKSSKSRSGANKNNDTSFLLASSTSTSTSCPVPHPDAQSFAYYIQTLYLLHDRESAVEEAKRVLGLYESLLRADLIDVPSPKPHNACMETYVRMFGRDKDKTNISKLMDMCSTVVSRLVKMTSVNGNANFMNADVHTWALMLRACAADDGDDINRIERMEVAESVYNELIMDDDNGDDEDGDDDDDNDNVKTKINDKCFFYMMKCIANNTNTNDTDSANTKEQIKGVFQQACKGGFVSADVLQMLRLTMSEDEFEDIVGDGRLADDWVINVTSGVALYTDGSTGGEGKNARRKGKSTSDWAKKQRVKGERIRAGKEAKVERKRLKKVREQKASSSRRR